ncbi:MAG: hypothetical protein K2H82_04175 [Oscillospiraceae bacterium]|nr:hypothetical protein [Oscillospiraceae bacterium]
MTKLSEEFISQLKEANPIVDVFNSYVQLKKRGRIYVCCCPFHVEKTPSCTVYPEESAHFYCFGCGESGDVISFLMKIENLSYMDAVRTLADRAGMTLPIQTQQEKKFQISHDKCYEINRKTANFYYDRLLRGNDKAGLQFLADHQIRPQTVKKFGIGFAADAQQLLHYLRSEQYSDQELLSAGVCRRNPDGSLSDYFQNQMILFPVLDPRGNITGFTGKFVSHSGTSWVTSPESTIFSQKKLLFCLNVARQAVTESDSKTLILAQDVLNAVTIWQNGFENVVAPLGTFIMPQLVKLISQYASEVIFTYQAERNILNYFSDADIPVRLLNLEQIRTPVDYFRQHSPEEFRNLLQQARDANLIQLETCQNGLNPESQEDKSILVQRNIQTLGEIRDALEREVYLVNIAKTLQISPDYLRIQLDNYLKRRTIPRKSRMDTRPLRKEELNCSAKEHQKKFRAEQQVLLFLLHCPEEVPEISRTLSPNCFYTNMHRNIYYSICEEQCHLLTPSQQSCITDIEEEYQGITPSRETITNCISILQNTGIKSGIAKNDVI